MGHDHAHAHSHSRTEGLGLAFGLNFAFTLIELVGAYFTNSTAIAADAVHDLGDSLALAFAWGMDGLADSDATETYSYGFRRLSVVGALANALVLVIGGGVVLFEAIPRLFDPPQAHAPGMFGLAVLGVVVNGAAVLRVRDGKTLNERVVTLHLLEDVLGWVAVLVVSAMLWITDWQFLDPLLSVGITGWVVFNALKHLRIALAVFLQAVPDDVDVPSLRELAMGVEGVVDLRHVHVWSHDGEHHVMTAQLLIETMELEAAIGLRDRVRDAFSRAGIDHSTLEIAVAEDGAGSHCGKVGV